MPVDEWKEGGSLRPRPACRLPAVVDGADYAARLAVVAVVVAARHIGVVQQVVDVDLGTPVLGKVIPDHRIPYGVCRYLGGTIDGGVVRIHRADADAGTHIAHAGTQLKTGYRALLHLVVAPEGGLVARDQARTTIAVAGVVGLGIGIGIGSGQAQRLGGLHAPLQFDPLGGHFTGLGLLAGAGRDQGVGLLQIEQRQVDVAIEEAGCVLDPGLV